MKKALSILALFLFVQTGFAQTDDLTKPLPVDPSVRTGVLPNGIKYYVRHNAKPEKRMELRLAVNTGSTAENDDQQGLAHFCEHMCFNGTKNFHKTAIVDYLESIGTKFGADLNAYTSFDETVYMMQVPTDQDSIVTKGLQILEDWAHNASFDSDEIDKERGVVTEEWRLGQGAQERMRRKYWPVLFKDSRYAERLPIGKPEILKNCSYETLRNFYKDWYRPDLQAVIAVGDFDVDKMEKKIKEEFGSIPKRTDGRPIKSWDVPDQKELNTSICSDKESQYTIVQINYKQPSEKMITHGDYRRNLVQDLYNGMINARLNELQKQADPPFIFASTGYSGMVRTKDAYRSFALVKQDGIERGITTLGTENERVKRFGLTGTELERMKKEMMRNIEKAFNEKDKTESRNLVSEYVNNFLDKEGIPGIEYEFDLYKKFIPGITLEEVNSLAKKWVTDGSNCTVIVMAAEKEGLTLPTDEQVRTAFKAAQTADIKAYEDKTINKPLLEKKPTAGTVTEEKKLNGYDITEWKLSNGARVLLKPTDFKNDEIRFMGYRMGGTSLAADKDYQSADFSNAIVEESGVGEFDKISLDKMMQGKIVAVSPGVGDITEEMSGSFSPQDMETAFQLIYLYHTSPRKDETAYKALIEQQKGLLQNRQSAPENVFRDTVSYFMSGYNYRSRPMTVEILNEVNLDNSLNYYKNRFGTSNGWVYTFVGNFKPESIKSFVETYIGGLPNNMRTENVKDLGIASPKGKAEKMVKKGSEPKSAVSLKWTGPFEYNRNHRNEMNALIKLLSITLRENLREDKGGVYGVGINPKLEHYPKGKYEITIGFGCAPDNVEKLIAAAVAEVENVKKDGCSEKNLTKIKETFIRERETYLKENSFWVSVISQSAMNNEDVLELQQYNKWVESIKPGDFKAWANKYFDMNEYKRFVLMPEKQTN